MKKAHLLHNPTAGEKEFSKTELLALIKDSKFDCTYASIREKGWDQFPDETDFLIIAGGDGTVRRVAKALMKRTLLEKQFPIALLPHGTANNIACTLNIDGKVSDIVHSWQDNILRKFDIGKIEGFGKNVFFLEGFGCGIFPRLIKVMEKIDNDSDSVEEKIKTARSVLYDIVLTYEAQTCSIVADGVEHSGKYIMVEVMNTQSIGPNLNLAKTADPDDGEFDIVLIPENDQKKFGEFLLNRINGKVDNFTFTTIKAKNIEITWQGKDVHVDDEKIKTDKPLHVSIEVLPGTLEFLVPKNK